MSVTNGRQTPPPAPIPLLRRWLNLKFWSPVVRTQRRLALGVLIGQATLTVTGSIVRVTGSGLGCNTWPNCHPGSLVPVAGAAPWIQQFIEFGNRTLTIALVLITGSLAFAVGSALRRNAVFNLALAQVLGVIIQAVIGGISVHLKLRWWVVALHFIPSIVLVFLAGVLFVRILEPDDGTRTPTYPRPLKGLAIGAVAALGVVIITGTMTTGAGVHSGDSGVGMQGRLNVDIAQMANIHAHFMYLYLGLTIGLVVALVASHTPLRTLKVGFWLIAMIVLQGAIGIIQYNWGVPTWTVPVHVGMSSVCTALSAIIYGHWARLQGTAFITGSEAGDRKRRTLNKD